MVRLAVALLAGFLALGGDASAATLYFVAVPTTETAQCPAPCYQIRMFYEDPADSAPVRGLEFDVRVLGDAVLAVLPDPPASSSAIANGNASANSTPQPWNLYAVVGKSPSPDQDVRVVEHADSGLTVESVSQIFASGCLGASCGAILDGLAAHRIYVGRFNVTWAGGVAGIRATTIASPYVGDPLAGMRNAIFDVEGFPSVLDPDFDGRRDPFDNCPLIANPDQRDSDHDGIGDACNAALDADGDEYRDEWDNCPSLANPLQANRDLDAFGDACDFCPDYSTVENVDFDGNGVGDPCECGDQTGDAVVNILDVLGINLVIFGAGRVSPLCDANYDGRCDVRDIVRANQKIFGRPAYCSRYPPPGP